MSRFACGSFHALPSLLARRGAGGVEFPEKKDLRERERLTLLLASRPLNHPPIIHKRQHPLRRHMHRDHPRRAR